MPWKGTATTGGRNPCFWPLGRSGESSEPGHPWLSELCASGGLKSGGLKGEVLLRENILNVYSLWPRLHSWYKVMLFETTVRPWLTCRMMCTASRLFEQSQKAHFQRLQRKTTTLWSPWNNGFGPKFLELKNVSSADQLYPFSLSSHGDEFPKLFPAWQTLEGPPYNFAIISNLIASGLFDIVVLVLPRDFRAEKLTGFLYQPCAPCDRE